MIHSFPSSVLIAYPAKGKASAFPVNPSNQIYVYNARAFNNTGGTINVGICRRFITNGFNLYSKSVSTYTEITSTVAGGIASNIFTGVNNDGYLVQANDRFNLVGLTISTAQAGGVFTYSYWNGTSFTTLTTLEVPTNYASTGDIYVVFRAPQDWVVGGPSGVNQDRYSIQVLSTTAPAGAVAANAIWVAEFLEFYKNVADASAVQLSFPDTKPFLLKGGETLIPYFSTTNATNQFGAYYSVV